MWSGQLEFLGTAFLAVICSHSVFGSVSFKFVANGCLIIWCLFNCLLYAGRFCSPKFRAWNCCSRCWFLCMGDHSSKITGHQLVDTDHVSCCCILNSGVVDAGRSIWRERKTIHHCWQGWRPWKGEFREWFILGLFPSKYPWKTLIFSNNDYFNCMHWTMSSSNH